MSKALPFRIFGIRHHGPGSARRLRQALDTWQPDCLLIEAPADGQSELEQAIPLGLEPPVALVVYDEKDLQHAFYYPFARFSPEWQALRWADQHGVPFHAMDLPVSQQLPLRKKPELLASENVPERMLRDPLGEAATLAGFDDKEQWWEVTFEKETDDLELFAAIEELMAALRMHYQGQERAETLIREAYMRKVLRKAIRNGHERIAIVCGAWHTPALAQVAAIKVGTDNQRLKGLPKTRTKAAWIPWSYPRLAKVGGYGAGVTSPAWYRLLFEYGAEAPVHWMVAVAQLLRSEGWDASPAHAQEAVRLARTLAAMQGQGIPSLANLRSAVLSTLCEGSEERLVIVEERLILGEKVGQVPENASQVPLQKDLQQQLKSSRLNKYWGIVGEQWVKANKAKPRGGIDLREPTDVQKSQLLHQLQLLNIQWGERQASGANDLGAFKEVWRLQWQPEFSLRIIEAAMWGNTVREAAGRCLQQQPDNTSLGQLAHQILLGLRAGLEDFLPPVISQLKDQAAVTRDVEELLLALPPLVSIIQYGDARKTDVTALALLLEGLVPRLAAGLPGVCTGIDEDVAQSLLKELLAVHRSLNLLQLPLLEDHWWPALRKLADLPTTHPLLQGVTVRLLFDEELLSLAAASQRMDYALSQGNESLDVAHWISGFLHGSGLLLLHHLELWHLVNNWVKSLDWTDLDLVLPLLRRTFASFSPGERQRILQRARQEKITQEHMPEPTINWKEDQATTVLRGLHSWLDEV